jgi:hypothetical protein
VKSPKPGANISQIEVTHIDEHGIWLYVNGAEYFLSHKEYPWFKEAKIKELLNVQLLHESHIHWPDLDIDLSVAQLKTPESYPLVYR